jgi:hypothetical protein
MINLKKSKAYEISEFESFKEEIEDKDYIDNDDLIIVLKKTPENIEISKRLFGDGVEATFKRK